MAVTPTHAAVVLNGLQDRGDPGAMVITVRCPFCGDRHVHGLPAPGAGRSGRHLWVSGCSVRRGRRPLGGRSQRPGRGDPAPARQPPAVEPQRQRASEPGTVRGAGPSLLPHPTPGGTGCPPCRAMPAARPSALRRVPSLRSTARQPICRATAPAGVDIRTCRITPSGPRPAAARRRWWGFPRAIAAGLGRTGRVLDDGAP